jgi:GAF domain-containing protein
MDSTGQEASVIKDSAVASAAAFAEVARSLFLADSVEQTLARAVDLSVLTIEACEFAGAFLLEKDTVTTPVCTAPIVAEVDALQLRTGEGPCLDAIAHKLTFYSDELGADPRWPDFGPEAAARGMRSLLALPMAANGTLGALSLYACYPQAFGVIDRRGGCSSASMASFASSAARAHADEERRAENLQAALVTRELIGQAQGSSSNASGLALTRLSTSCARPPSISTSSSEKSPKTSSILARDQTRDRLCPSHRSGRRRTITT